MSSYRAVQLLNPIQINTNIHPTGVYNAATSYGIGDSVSYGNSSYICILPTTGNVPTNTTYWQLLASSATNKLSTTARNLTGATIPKMSVVYFSGVNGNLPTLSLSQANGELSSTKTIGITATAIANNADGEIVIFGLADNLDTTAFTGGSSLWLSPTVAGGMTATKPSAPNHMVFIGFVTRSHPTSGTIEVKVQNGFELEELHNVAISSISDNQVLKYDAPDSLWKNETLVKADVGLPNVDDTSDANKPISSATQTALNLKEDLSNKSTSTSLGTSDTLYPSQNAVKAYVDTNVLNATNDTFEKISKNLKSYPYSLNYTTGILTSIVYTLGGGQFITKTLNYTSGTLTSIVLSGTLPSQLGSITTKSLTYTSGALTGISYS